jgi:hypothetical protein
MSINLEAEERRSKIERRRSARLIAHGGLAANFERIGDRLITLGEIACQLADTVPGLAYEVVVRRFVFSVRNGGFGFRWYGDRQAVTNLLDMHSFASRYAPEPTSYVLRPSVHTVAMAPQVMLARASIWAKWLPKQGWPVPPELATVVVIDVEADEVAAPLMLPAPVVVPEPEPGSAAARCHTAASAHHGWRNRQDPPAGEQGNQRRGGGQAWAGAPCRHPCRRAAIVSCSRRVRLRRDVPGHGCDDESRSGEA